MTEAHYSWAELQARSDLYPVVVETLTLDDLARAFPGQDALFKIDIEGEEESFILGDMDDAPLRTARYVAIELHSLGAPDGRAAKIAEWLDSFESTHIVTIRPNPGVGGMVWMTKRAEASQ